MGIRTGGIVSSLHWQWEQQHQINKECIFQKYDGIGECSLRPAKDAAGTIPDLEKVRLFARRNPKGRTGTTTTIQKSTTTGIVTDVLESKNNQQQDRTGSIGGRIEKAIMMVSLSKKRSNHHTHFSSLEAQFHLYMPTFPLILFFGLVCLFATSFFFFSERLYVNRDTYKDIQQQQQKEKERLCKTQQEQNQTKKEERNVSAIENIDLYIQKHVKLVPNNNSRIHFIWLFTSMGRNCSCPFLHHCHRQPQCGLCRQNGDIPFSPKLWIQVSHFPPNTFWDRRKHKTMTCCCFDADSATTKHLHLNNFNTSKYSLPLQKQGVPRFF